MNKWMILASLSVGALVQSGLIIGGYIRPGWWGILVNYVYCGAMGYFIWIKPSQDFRFLRDWHWKMTVTLGIFIALGYFSFAVVTYEEIKSLRKDGLSWWEVMKIW